MSLYAQQYPNPSRVVSGTITINNDDVVLYCNTSSAAVVINLIAIPSNYWMTTWKLYVVDNSNNASTNNITINAPSGFLINGQSSLTLNSNKQTALIRIATNTDFIAYTSTGNGSNLAVLNQGTLITSSASSMNFVGIQASASGSAVTIQNNFISGTYAQITALATANSLIPSQGYQITNALYGTLPVKNIAIYLTAISTNELSLTGSGYFYNADYDGVGVYTGVPGYAGQLGIWKSTLSPVVGNVCTWNNLHYVNITGSNGASNPYVDTTNWTVLAYSTTNGYIAEIDFIKYDISTNRIIERQDVRLNSLTWCTSFVGYDSFNHFRWGDNKCLSNQLIDSVLYNCNNLLESLYNFLSNSSVVNGSATSGGSANFVQNQFIDSTISIPFESLGGEALLLNNIQNSQVFFTKNNFTLVDIGNFARNTLNNSSCADITFEGQYTHNVFDNCTSTVLNQTRSGYISYNTVSNSTFDVTNNTKNILTNEIIANSVFTIGVINTGLIDSNLISQNSQLNINTNSSTIQNNLFVSSSQLNLENNTNLVYNNYFYDTTFTSATAQSGRMFDNNFNNCVLTIPNCSQNLSINVFKNSTINITTLSASISENQVSNGTLNTTNITTAITGGIYIEGIATTAYVLSLSDATIFNAGTLTIPSGLAFFFGVYTLQNCSGQNISKISTNNSDVPIRFLPDANTVIFTRTAIGAATSNDIVASTTTATWTLTYRTNGNDSIQLRRLGNLNGVIATEIYV
jgi:hypothetical protein